MDGVYQFGIALIGWLQGASPALDGFMQGVTFLGTIEFYILFIPILYWCVNRSLGLRILFILILTDFPASCFKHLLHQPRPYWVGGVKALGNEPSYGIPSTHASNTLAVWGLIANTLKKSWMWAFTIILLFLIGLTRLYLGMHFPQDVLGGWLIGLIMLLLYLKYESRFLAWWFQKTLQAQIGLGFLLSITMIGIGMLVLTFIANFSDPPEWASFATEARDMSHYLTLSGFIFGAVAGAPLMNTYANFKIDGSAIQRFGRYLIGMIGIFILYLGLDLLFALIATDISPLEYVLRYIRYASVGFWTIFVAPWCFIKVGLAERPVRSRKRTEAVTLP